MAAPATLQDRAAARLMRTYPPAKVAFVEGRGSVLVDEQGHEWLDFLCGLAVTSLGHAHPAVAAAVAGQAQRLVHTSNLYVTEPAVALAEDLARITGWDDARVFFAQCGATANEAAIKLARRHGKNIADDKVRLVTLEGSFHGRTLATLEATGQAEKHRRFAPLAGFVDTVAHDDPAALTAAVGPKTSAVMLEIIQGEGGVRPLSPQMLAAARAACDAHDALLIVDEVQTGIGRTGSWFAFQDADVVPDVITVAKALANGMPIGACIARGKAAEVLQPGDHATTFGGNPVTCAAAQAVIATIEREEILQAAQQRSQQLRDGIEAMAATLPVAGAQGKGLLLGIALTQPLAAAVEAACRQQRIIVNAIGDRLVRIAPPLTVTAEEVVDALARIAAAIADAVDASKETS